MVYGFHKHYFLVFCIRLHRNLSERVLRLSRSLTCTRPKALTCGNTTAQGPKVLVAWWAAALLILGPEWGHSPCEHLSLEGVALSEARSFRAHVPHATQAYRPMRHEAI